MRHGADNHRDNWWDYRIHQQAAWFLSDEVEVVMVLLSWFGRLGLKKAMERFGEAGLLLALLASCLMDLRFLQLHFLHQVVGCHMGQRGVDKPVVRYVSGEVAQGAYESLRRGKMKSWIHQFFSPGNFCGLTTGKAKLYWMATFWRVTGSQIVVVEGLGWSLRWMASLLLKNLASPASGRHPSQQNLEKMLRWSLDAPVIQNETWERSKTVETMEKSLKQGQVETFSQAALILDPSLSTKYFLHLVVCIRMSTGHADMLVFC